MVAREEVMGIPELARITNFFGHTFLFKVIVVTFQCLATYRRWLILIIEITIIKIGHPLIELLKGEVLLPKYKFL